MDVTITERPAFVLAGHAARVPLIYAGVNPHIQRHIASIAPEEHARLKSLNDTDPRRHPGHHRRKRAGRAGGHTDHICARCCAAARFDGAGGSAQSCGTRRPLGHIPVVRSVSAGAAGDLGGDGHRVVPVQSVVSAARADIRPLLGTDRVARRRGDLDAGRAGLES